MGEVHEIFFCFDGGLVYNFVYKVWLYIKFQTDQAIHNLEIFMGLIDLKFDIQPNLTICNNFYFISFFDLLLKKWTLLLADFNY